MKEKLCQEVSTGRCHARAPKVDRDDAVTRISRDEIVRDRASRDDGRGHGRWSCDATTTMMRMKTKKTTRSTTRSARRDRSHCDGRRGCRVRTKRGLTRTMRRVRDHCAI